MKTERMPTMNIPKLDLSSFDWMTPNLIGLKIQMLDMVNAAYVLGTC